MATPLRLGRNMPSLAYTSDITPRANRIQPLTATLGGAGTYLGSARWVVTGNASGVITLADPAGGPPPVGFDDQFNTIGTYYLYREITAKAYAIADSAVSPNTVTITGDPGIAVGEFVQFRTSSTAGTAIPVGPGGLVSSLSRGYILPLLATGKASNVLTLSSYISTPAQPTADDQYVGDDVAFSNFVQTSVVDVIGTATWPNYTLNWVSGTDFSGLAVGDWLITGDLSVWEGGGGGGTSLPPMTVTAVTDSTHIEVTIRGAGPSFNQGAVSVSSQFFRPVAANLTGTVTASSASAHTLTVDDATGLTATTGAPCALELSYTPVVGQLPYYLDHPDYIVSPATVTDTGIGLKYGTIQRGTLVSVANLSPNAFARNATAGVADGYSVIGAGSSMSLNTDPLFTELGGQSILVTLGSGGQFRTPTIRWRPAFQGQRMSVRAHLLFPANWSGNRELDLRFGIVKADGSTLLWTPPDKSVRMFPPDMAGTLPPDGTQPVAGAWFDAVLPGFDITTAVNIAPLSVRQSDLADAVGYFVAFVNTTNAPPFYFDGIAITVSDVAPDSLATFGEFGQANKAHQDTNFALSLIAKPLPSITVQAVDLYAMNPDSSDAIDKLTYPGDVLAHAPSLGLVNETIPIVEIKREDLKRPGKVTLTLGRKEQRFTDLFLAQTNAIAASSSSATTGAQSSGNTTTTVTPPPGGTTGTGTSGGLSITLGVALDALNVPTATAVGSSSVVRVKFAGRTDRYPTADEVRAETSIIATPFTTSFAALTSGQTEYVSALPYDAADTEGAIAQASATVGTTTPAVPWLFLRKAVNMYQGIDGDPTTLGPASSSGDKIAHWLDANGNSRQAKGILDAFSHFSLVPTRSGDAANLNDGYLQLPDMSAFTEGVIMARLTATSGAVTNKLWLMNRSGFQAGNVALYPDSSDGHIKDSWGTSSRTDFGDPGVSLTVPRTYEVHSSAATRVAELDGATLPTTDSPPATGVWFNSTPRLSGSINTEVFDGLCDHLVIFDFVPTEAQLQDWRDFLNGTTGGIAPTDVTGGSSVVTLTAVRSGGDVIVTATSRFASSVKIAASLTDNPVTDAEVRAATALTTRPFQATFAAPPAGQTLHIGAFAYFASLGGTESTKATLDVPSLAGTFGGSSGGDGTITVPVVTTDGSGNVTGVTEATISVAGWTPTRIPSGETFTVPADKQVLFALPIAVEGSLLLDGSLIMVD